MDTGKPNFKHVSELMVLFVNYILESFRERALRFCWPLSSIIFSFLDRVDAIVRQELDPAFVQG